MGSNVNSYNTELTLSPDGKYAVYTSDVTGDLELYSFPVDEPSEVRRLTYTPGYDGGAYYSNDGTMLCWRAYRPHGDNLTDYVELIKLGLVVPLDMQLYVANADGTNARMVGPLGGTNFAPYFLPDDSGLIFSSNMHDPMGGNFQLYTVDLDGSNLQQITFDGSFNSFPMFSRRQAAGVGVGPRHHRLRRDQHLHRQLGGQPVMCVRACACVCVRVCVNVADRCK